MSRCRWLWLIVFHLCFVRTELAITLVDLQGLSLPYSAPQSSPLFDGARGKNGDTAVLQQMFVAGEFIPGFSDVNSNMGNLSMALDTQYYGAPVNRHLPIRRELSPSDSLKHENFAKVSSSIFIFK